jgi:hypothetical protein
LVPVASLGQYQLVPASNKPKSVPYNTSNSSVYQYTSLPVYTQIKGPSNPTAYSIPAHKHTSTGTRQSTQAHKYTSTSGQSNSEHNNHISTGTRQRLSDQQSSEHSKHRILVPVSQVSVHTSDQVPEHKEKGLHKCCQTLVPVSQVPVHWYQYTKSDREKRITHWYH